VLDGNQMLNSFSVIDVSLFGPEKREIGSDIIYTRDGILAVAGSPSLNYVAYVETIDGWSYVSLYDVEQQKKLEKSTHKIRMDTVGLRVTDDGTVLTIASKIRIIQMDGQKRAKRAWRGVERSLSFVATGNAFGEAICDTAKRRGIFFPEVNGSPTIGNGRQFGIYHQ
jgi:hypothetical protein